MEPASRSQRRLPRAVQFERGELQLVFTGHFGKQIKRAAKRELAGDYRDPRLQFMTVSMVMQRSRSLRASCGARE